MSTNRMEDDLDDLNALQASERIELKSEMENVLRAKLGEYRERLNIALSQERVPSAALDTKVKILILEELLKHKKIGGGDVVVKVSGNEQVLDLALTIGERKKMDPATLIAFITTNALGVIRDYNDNAGDNVDMGGGLPKKGVPRPDQN